MGQHRPSLDRPEASVRVLFVIEVLGGAVVLALFLTAIAVVGLHRPAAPAAAPAPPSPAGTPEPVPVSGPPAAGMMTTSAMPVDPVRGAGTSRQPAASPARPSPSRTDFCVRVTHDQNTRWPGGFQEQFFVANCGTTTIDGWTVTVHFSGTVSINVWNAGRSGGTATVVPFTALDYDRVIGPGGSVTFGFNATYGGADRVITGCEISGGTCR
jgi:hypothetical protein